MPAFVGHQVIISLQAQDGFTFKSETKLPSSSQYCIKCCGTVRTISLTSPDNE